VQGSRGRTRDIGHNHVLRYFGGERVDAHRAKKGNTDGEGRSTKEKEVGETRGGEGRQVRLGQCLCLPV